MINNNKLEKIIEEKVKERLESQKEEIREEARREVRKELESETFNEDNNQKGSIQENKKVSRREFLKKPEWVQLDSEQFLYLPQQPN